MQLLGFDLIAITETWQDSSHDWNDVMNGYTLVRKDRTGRQGDRVDLHVRTSGTSGALGCWNY